MMILSRIGVILLFICSIACHNDHSSIPYFDTADFEPLWIGDEIESNTNLHKIADFSFVNQNNETVTNDTYKDKLYVTDFFFTTCPSICPMMTKNMYHLQEHFKETNEVMLLSHTVTPWVDSVAQLKRYAIANEVIDSKWNLVTGTEEDLYRIARTSYFAEKEIGLQLSSDDFLHTENFILVDGNRHIRGIYNGTIKKDIERIKEDIEVLLKEKRIKNI